MAKRTCEKTALDGIDKRYCETVVESKEDCFIWKISGFSLFQKTMGNFIDSAKFYATVVSRSNWTLELYSRKFSSAASDDITISIDSSTKQEHATYGKVSIVNAAGELTNTRSFSYGKKTYHEIPKFLQWSKLLSKKHLLLPNDELTIHLHLEFVFENSCRIGCTPLVEEFFDDKTNPLTENLGEMLVNKTFADVTLKLGDTTILAHKAILACRSPVFSAMFTSGMSESRTNEILVSDVDVDVFRALLQFLYTQKVNFPSVDFTLKLLLCSDKYDVQSLKTVCTTALLGGITSEQVLDVLLVADACNEAELTKACLKHITGCKMSPLLLLNWMKQCGSSPQILDMLERILK